MLASVSMSALKRVQGALQKFEVDIAGITAKTERRAREVLQSAEGQLAKIQGEISDSQCRCNQLSDQLVALDKELTFVENQYQQCQKQIALLQNKCKELKQRIAELEAELASAKGAEDKDGKEAARAARIERALARAKAELASTQEQLGTEQERLRTLYTRREKLQQQYNWCQADLDNEKANQARLVNKQRKMQYAYGNMKRDVEEHVQAVRNLEYASTSVSKQNLSAVQRCIVSIEKYLTTPV